MDSQSTLQYQVDAATPSINTIVSFLTHRETVILQLLSSIEISTFYGGIFKFWNRTTPFKCNIFLIIWQTHSYQRQKNYINKG